MDQTTAAAPEIPISKGRRPTLIVCAVSFCVCASSLAALVVIWAMSSASDSSLWTEVVDQGLDWAGVKHTIGDSGGSSSLVLLFAAFLAALAAVSFFVGCAAAARALWLTWTNPSDKQAQARQLVGSGVDKGKQLGTAGAGRGLEMSQTGMEKGKEISKVGMRKGRELGKAGATHGIAFSKSAHKRWSERREQKRNRELP